jgi:hypothetical protein
MKVPDLLKRLEKPFGYDLQGHPAVELEVKSRLKLRAGRESEYLDDLMFGNVHWRGEAQPGEDPFEGEDQPVELLAHHLCGLFALRGTRPYGYARMTGSWLLDLNPRPDRVASPLYFRREGDEELLTKWWLLEGPAALEESHELFGEVKAVHQAVADGADSSKLAKAANEMIKGYPRVCDAFRPWFVEFGVDGPRGPFEDSCAPRLLRAYESLLAIARVLIARCQGDRRATLDQKMAKAALAAAEKDGDYPPALMVRLLATALASPNGDKTLAREIIERKQGVPLTRRWAELVGKNDGPFRA